MTLDLALARIAGVAMDYHPEGVLPMPLAQLARILRANFSDGENEFTREFCEGIWALSRHHRVQGLALAGMEKLGIEAPREIRVAIAKDAKANAVANLQAVRDCAELDLALREDGIDHLFIKGLTLSKLAYGNSLIKTGRDVDILVSPGELLGTQRTLGRLGYQCILPSRSHLERWHRVHKESIWWREGSLPVEIHDRLSDNPKLLRKVSLSSPRQDVDVAPNVTLETIANQHLFAYLAVHGASSLWFRLKWLCDFAALLSRKDSYEIDELSKQATDLGAGTTFIQALALAHPIFGTALGPVALKAVGSPAVRFYRRLALTQITSIAEPTGSAFGTVRIRLSSLLSKGSVGFAPHEAARQVRAMLLRR